jgi:hypothetical protein
MVPVPSSHSPRREAGEGESEEAKAGSFHGSFLSLFRENFEKNLASQGEADTVSPPFEKGLPETAALE